jgi:FKBP-type peptidyl-prolyl cis-trans isomerase SlyD
MKITLPCVVSLSWHLEDSQGNRIDALSEPVEFLAGGFDLLPKVEAALIGHTVGYTASLHLEPEDAFGEYDSALVCFEARELFPEVLEIGMQFDGPPEGAITPNMPSDAFYTVTEIYPDHVVLDGNHPLAGIALRLHLTVHQVRPATEQEQQDQSVDSGGGWQVGRMAVRSAEGTLH